MTIIPFGDHYSVPLRSLFPWRESQQSVSQCKQRQRRREHFPSLVSVQQLIYLCLQTRCMKRIAALIRIWLFIWTYWIRVSTAYTPSIVRFSHEDFVTIALDIESTQSTIVQFWSRSLPLILCTWATRTLDTWTFYHTNDTAAQCGFQFSRYRFLDLRNALGSPSSQTLAWKMSRYGVTMASRNFGPAA